MAPEGGPKDERNEAGGVVRCRRFTDEFKRDAGRLVVEGGYTFKAVTTAVGVSDQSLRAWHATLEPAAHLAASTPRPKIFARRTSGFQKKLRRAEMKRDILKKATAYRI